MTLKNWTSSASSTSAVTDLMQVGSGNIAVVIGGVITNYETTSAASVTVEVTDSSNVLKGYLYNNNVDPGASVHIDTRVVLNNQDKIRISSDLDEVSFIMSGDESSASATTSTLSLTNWTSSASATSAVTDLMQVGSGNIAAVIGGIISNYEATSAANVAVMLTDSSNVLKGYIFNDSVAPNETVHIDTRVALANQDKIRISSDLDEVSVILSGDEMATTIVDSVRHPHKTSFERTSNSAITMTSGMYPHWGTDNQLVYWDSAITFTFTSAGSNPDSDNMSASCFQYLYLDDSAIQSAGTNEITSARIINKLTKPARNNSKHGRYDGNDRCIGALWINSSGNIASFYHSCSEYIQFGNPINLFTNATPSTTWTDATAKAPFGDEGDVEIQFLCQYVNANWAYYKTRKNGTSDAGHVCGFVAATASYDVAKGCRQAVDENGVFEHRFGVAGSNQATANQNGYFLPGDV